MLAEKKRRKKGIIINVVIITLIIVASYVFQQSMSITWYFYINLSYQLQ
jgi:uncharacterized protein YpmB